MNTDCQILVRQNASYIKIHYKGTKSFTTGWRAPAACETQRKQSTSRKGKKRRFNGGNQGIVKLYFQPL